MVLPGRSFTDLVYRACAKHRLSRLLWEALLVAGGVIALAPTPDLDVVVAG